jgi:hypothetical protein
MSELPPTVLRIPRQERKDRAKELIESAKRILIEIQLRDNLEKTVVLRDDDGKERRILIKPKSSFDCEKKKEVLVLE